MIEMSAAKGSGDAGRSRWGNIFIREHSHASYQRRISFGIQRGCEWVRLAHGNSTTSTTLYNYSNIIWGLVDCDINQYNPNKFLRRSTIRHTEIIKYPTGEY